MKKILLLMVGLWAACAVSARELVVTLQNGQRIAFHLSSTEDVVMTQTAEQVILSGTALNRSDIKELRIFQQLPEDAIPVGIQDIENDGFAIHHSPFIMDSTAVYDLSGRRVATSALEFATQSVRPRAGVYLINNKKVVIR